MKLKIYQIVATFLLPAFLLVSIGSAPAYAWCFGEEVHLEIEEKTISGYVGHQEEPKEAAKYDIPSFYSSDDKHCGTCFHLSAQQNKATYSKRPEKPLNVPVDVTSLNVLPQAITLKVGLVAVNLASQPPPRISQALLALRTVVLLN